MITLETIRESRQEVLQHPERFHLHYITTHRSACYQWVMAHMGRQKKGRYCKTERCIVL